LPALIWLLSQQKSHLLLAWLSREWLGQGKTKNLRLTEAPSSFSGLALRIVPFRVGCGTFRKT
jgi:hypothetical protein